MVRISLTGILTMVGLLLVVTGLVAAAPARAWEPVCRGSGALEPTSFAWMVEREVAEPGGESFDTLMAWCGADQLCRLQVLDARPEGDARAEVANCRSWTPDYQLTCEMSVRARHP